MTQRTVCIATSTRADWGILRPLAESLRASDGIVLQILATNMHLMHEYGHTVDDIIADGFDVDMRVPMPGGDSPLQRAEAMGQCLEGTARAMTRLCPDALVILGDRYEMLAVASAAAMLHIPVIHLHGGEISEGAIDDSLRHAITKLSSLHITAAEPYRRRVVQMGEDPDRVINAGSLGVWSMMNGPVISRQDLCSNLGLDPDKPLIVSTFHPATNDTAATPGQRCRSMLRAFDAFADMQVIITYPNNDAGNEEIIAEITAWAKANSHRAALVKSLGMSRYLSAIRHADVVVGNSSSAIIEVPAAGTPAVNIGMRQRGRLHSPLVIDCGDSTEQIVEAMRLAMTPEFCEEARRSENPYFKPDTPAIATAAIIDFVDSLPHEPKKFFDLKQ